MVINLTTEQKCKSSGKARFEKRWTTPASSNARNILIHRKNTSVNIFDLICWNQHKTVILHMDFNVWASKICHGEFQPCMLPIPLFFSFTIKIGNVKFPFSGWNKPVPSNTVHIWLGLHTALSRKLQRQDS